MIGSYARRLRAPDYPWGPTAEERDQFCQTIIDEWGGPVGYRRTRAVSRARSGVSLVVVGVSANGLEPRRGGRADADERPGRHPRRLAQHPRAGAGHPSYRRSAVEDRRGPIPGVTHSRARPWWSCRETTICRSSAINWRSYRPSINFSVASNNSNFRRFRGFRGLGSSGFGFAGFGFEFTLCTLRLGFSRRVGSRFQMSNQPCGRLESFADPMLVQQQFILCQEALIVSIDHVIEHFVQRPLGDAGETSELLVAEPPKTLGDIAWT